MDNTQYLELFVEESQEHLQNINRNLLWLEQHPEETEVVNEVFRSAHTLKGMAGSMEFNAITQISHAMENVLDNVRSGNTKLTPEIIDILFECLDYLESLLQDIINYGEERHKDQSILKSKLEASVGSVEDNHKPELAAATGPEGLTLDQYQEHIIREAIKSGFRAYFIHIKLQETCLMKAARAFIIFKTIEGYGEIIVTQPSVQDIEEENFDFDFSLVVVTKADKDKLLNEVNSISEIDSVDIAELDDKELHKIYSGHTDKNEADDRRAKGQRDGKVPGTLVKSIRVDIEKLDSLMNLVSELIITKNRIQDIRNRGVEGEMDEAIEYLGRITNNLHDAVMKARMVPLQMVFDRFPRIVRDLARNSGKEIKLNITGAETEIDRTIIDELGDPLIHLIRNAIDHGIESSDQRRLVGKPATGKVEIKAYHDGDSVVIEVIDDGRGIDVEKILKRAVESKLLTPEEADNLSLQEAFRLIFQPGFSTADKVTNISGRGVGMDVVRTKIESLGGTVDIESQTGSGTKFTIRLPLSLSIIQALLISIGEEIYAIPISTIKEVLDIPSEDIKRLHNKEMIDYRGLLIPFIRLDSLLECPAEQKDRDDEYITTVIVSKGERLAALSAGNLLGRNEIVIKSLGKALGNIKIVSGATILGDGQVALILDINYIV
ncbi:MAG: chemotaxis protein CheA [Clostridiales bacterium]|jgi:two-component system chemotaxis sensor kinase CheA|nr:chemotaxis protein CheA [Clostridiales bacterium]